MMMRYTHIIVHHTGAEEKDAEQVRRYHMSLGWRDVGYNYLIERNGRIVAGRALELIGAHCRAGNMNNIGIGVALIGNFDEHPPARVQADSLLGLLKKLVREHGILPGRVLGHREVPGAATACPGRYLDTADLRNRLKEDAPAAKNACEEGTPEPVGPILWRVLAGAFQNREAAERQASRIKELGIEAWVMPPSNGQ